MTMFDRNRRYIRCYNQPIIAPIVDQICTCQCIIPMGDLSKIGSAWSGIAWWVWGLRGIFRSAYFPFCASYSYSPSKFTFFTFYVLIYYHEYIVHFIGICAVDVT